MMKAKNEAKAVQKPDYGIYRKLLIALTAVLVVAPVLFTLVQMGLFAGEPTVDIKPTAGPDAPVLRVAADYDFCPQFLLQFQWRAVGAVHRNRHRGGQPAGHAGGI